MLLTFCLECSCSSHTLSPQIPQTGLGSIWNGFQRSPIWGPYCRRRERQCHPVWSCKDHGWRERRDHCWEWQAHRASESSRRQPIPSMIHLTQASVSLTLYACTRFKTNAVIFHCILCCRQTWLHQVGMSLKSISGTWITLALQWHQDQKLRYFIYFINYIKILFSTIK